MRGGMAFLAAVGLLLAMAVPAVANNDPHRSPMGWGAFDLAGPCAFTVHFETSGKEYTRASTLPDGAMLVTFTGAARGTLSNPTNGKAIELNLSGPGSFTFAPDGSFVGQQTFGRGILWAPNLTAFGLPSNLVATSGPTSWSAAPANNWAGYLVTSMRTPPHVVADVCAALR